ncbi:hypothetical protein DFH28DRAFT_973060 [Melampsora americana]|nr:hypothetical protein DFH28DRAFT_973060 [Melampsora americana]
MSDEQSKYKPRPRRPRRRRVEFLCPSTKVKDLELEEQEGRTLENRRVWTLILDESNSPNFFNGTSTRAPDEARGRLNEVPYRNFTSPSFWLLANRWMFLPKSKSQLRLIERILKEARVLNHRVGLLEARESIMKWVVQRSESEDLVEFIMDKKLIDFTMFYQYACEV